MKTSNAMQLKALVNNYAVENRLIPQIVLQNYHLQRFVERLVRSKYRKKFVIKGGLLLSALYGLDRRTTMDIDATVTGIAAGRESLAKAVGDICAIDVDDGIDFSLVGISDIAEHNGYPGFRAEIAATYGRMKTTLLVDVTTGDKITPGPVESEMPLLFEARSIKVSSYTIESLLAEKLHTILSRGVLNTRPRDFYDVHLIAGDSRVALRPDVLRRAVAETFAARQSADLIGRSRGILDDVAKSKTMRDRWESYRCKFDYAGSIGFDEAVDAVRRLVELTSSND